MAAHTTRQEELHPEYFGRPLPRRLRRIHELSREIDKHYDACTSEEYLLLHSVLTQYLSQPVNLRLEYERKFLGYL